MVHRKRTAFRNSENTYGGNNIREWKFLKQGVLQGNVHGPSIWTALSSLVLKIMQKGVQIYISFV